MESEKENEFENQNPFHPGWKAIDLLSLTSDNPYRRAYGITSFVTSAAVACGVVVTSALYAAPEISIISGGIWAIVELYKNDTGFQSSMEIPRTNNFALFVAGRKKEPRYPFRASVVGGVKDGLRHNLLTQIPAITYAVGAAVLSFALAGGASVKGVLQDMWNEGRGRKPSPRKLFSERFDDLIEQFDVMGWLDPNTPEIKINVKLRARGKHPDFPAQG